MAGADEGKPQRHRGTEANPACRAAPLNGGRRALNQKQFIRGKECGGSSAAIVDLCASVSLWLLLSALLTPTAVAQDASPPPDPIPRDQLGRIYRHGLEGLDRPADADKVYGAHQLLERYFAAAPERKALVKQIEATGLDVNLLGRLARIRMNWPALEPGGVYYVNERFGTHTVRYFLGVPTQYDRTRPWPLVIKLPGAH